MIKRFSDLPVERKLAIAAILLGFIALFGANPYEHIMSSVNAKEIAFAAGSKSTKIDPLELAGWIIKAKADYKLVDVRSESEFNEYHIPQALNLSLMELQNSRLERTEKIVFYSNNEMEAAQAWFLLRAKGYKAVYILSGGLEEWKSRVLFPAVAASTNSEEQMKAEKLIELSKFFGGNPRTSGVDSGTPGEGGSTLKTQAEMPKLQAPIQQSGGGASAPKKKKEGC